MKQHSVRRLLSLVICIFVLVSLFSVFALAENELETVELEIPNPAPEFPTLWVQAVAPDNSVVSNLLLELVHLLRQIAAVHADTDRPRRPAALVKRESCARQRCQHDQKDNDPDGPVFFLLCFFQQCLTHFVFTFFTTGSPV